MTETPPHNTLDAGLRPFVHLHLHSEYSLVDGAIRISDLIQKVQSFGQTAVAMTDHGNLFGAIEFYTKAKEKGIKAIIGSEIYCNGDDKVRAFLMEQGMLRSAEQSFHLVILAKNCQGYHNLCRMVSHGYLDHSAPVVPLVSEKVLEQNSSDVIVLSSCLMGVFAQLVRCLQKDLGAGKVCADLESMQRQPAYAFLQEHVDQMHRRFGRGNYFIELIDNNLPQQRTILDDLAAVARHFDLPLVASADAHYLNEDDRDAHTALVAIKNEYKLSDLRDRRRNCRFHLLSPQEFCQIYSRWPEAIDNTIKIAEQCQVDFEFGNYILPRFDLGTGEDSETALLRLAKEGLQQRLPTIERWYGPEWSEQKLKEYTERLDYELGVIIKMGFPGYFLIVQDFINWAKNQDIPVGPGRGSGAGSLVAYCLRITDLDPLPFHLIFERFLNPERVSMPDFDIDFCQDRRDEVIQYVVERYGKNNVAQITTFGKMLAKAALRDVGRVMDLSYGKVDRIAKLVPNEIGIKLKDAIATEPRIEEEAQKDPLIADMLELALKLEGLSRHTSVHAAGLVIAEGGMENIVPVYKDDEGSLITQFEMKNAEKVGLVKFDFLGLKTLTVIQKCVQILRKRRAPDLNIETIPLDDPKVFELVSKARSIGVFQLETGGMRQLLPKLQPSSFEDIIAMVALFRPGPLQSGMVDDFIERKHGRQKVEYLLPQLEPILKETYGTIVYQEQVQKIAAILASYSLGEADLLRRAMGKKKPEEMAKQKVRFVKGCVDNSIDSDRAEALFDMMAKFAEYGFNKSHSAGYALVSYQTAYLKTHFPEEFMAAIMTCDMDNTDKLVRYINDCRNFQIKVLPPDLNESEAEFTVPRQGQVRFAMAAIKGLGISAVKPILEERQRGGAYSSLSDLAQRVPLHKVGKKTLEMLVQAGAFDSFGIERMLLQKNVADLVRYSENLFQARLSGTRLLFEDDDAMGVEENFQPQEGQDPSMGKEHSFPLYQDLEAERKLLGVYVSAHPVERHPEDLRIFGQIKLNQLSMQEGKGSVRCLCLVEECFERTNRDGKRTWMVNLSDESDAIQLPYFGAEAEHLPPNSSICLLQFKVTKGFEGRQRIRIEAMTRLQELRRQRLKGLKIRLKLQDGHQTSALSFRSLNQQLRAHPGSTPIKIDLSYPEGVVSLSSRGIEVSDTLLAYLKRRQDICDALEFIV